MGNVIKASEFTKYLQKQGLVIVSKYELERLAGVELHQKRKDLLRKKFLTIREMLQLDLLPIKSKSGVMSWIENGSFLEHEVAKNDKNQTIILTSSLNRLGYV